MRVLRLRDFRLLWTGEAISGLGDQFALIALPWLALVLTGSGLALGSVLALMALPRAALMVVGGAYVDRLSPRRVMLASNAVRLLAVTLLGAAVFAGAAQLWMLYAFALVFGIADAFFFPAVSAVVPALVPGEQLGQANAIVQGTGQLTRFRRSGARRRPDRGVRHGGERLAERRGNWPRPAARRGQLRGIDRHPLADPRWHRRTRKQPPNRSSRKFEKESVLSRAGRRCGSWSSCRWRPTS